jgi:short-subunit dehydrogenase
VIAGASSGIGAATARSLAASGHSVHLLSRDATKLSRLADELGGTYAVLDVRSPEPGPWPLPKTIDVAVYAVGTMTVQKVRRHSLADWDDALAVNLTGAFLFSRQVADLIVPGGRLIFISSTTGSRGSLGLAAYSATKGGLDRLAESLAEELQPLGVATHLVVPGPVATAMLDVPGAPRHQLEPEQVADAIRWLTSLPGDIVLPRLEIHAVSSGPFARER